MIHVSVGTETLIFNTYHIGVPHILAEVTKLGTLPAGMNAPAAQAGLEMEGVARLGIKGCLTASVERMVYIHAVRHCMAGSAIEALGCGDAMAAVEVVHLLDVHAFDREYFDTQYRSRPVGEKLDGVQLHVLHERQVAPCGVIAQEGYTEMVFARRGLETIVPLVVALGVDDDFAVRGEQLHLGIRSRVAAIGNLTDSTADGDEILRREGDGKHDKSEN